MDRIELIKNAPRDLPEHIILTTGTRHVATYEELDDLGIRGYGGLRNVPKASGDNRGAKKMRFVFMKHTSGLRLLSDSLKKGPYKTAYCPNCRKKVADQKCPGCKVLGKVKAGHWEMWKFQLTHPGNTQQGIEPEDETLTWFCNVEKGKCNTCSDKYPGMTHGWYALPKCPHCKKKLTYVPEYDQLTFAILDALKNHPDGGVTNDNWENWECRIKELRGGKERYQVEFLPWGLGSDEPPATFVKASNVVVEPPPVQEGLDDRLQGWVDAAQVDIEDMPTTTLMSRSKWMNWALRTGYVEQDLTPDEVAYLWDDRWKAMPYWPIPKE